LTVTYGFSAPAVPVNRTRDEILPSRSRADQIGAFVGAASSSCARLRATRVTAFDHQRPTGRRARQLVDLRAPQQRSRDSAIAINPRRLLGSSHALARRDGHTPITRPW